MKKKHRTSKEVKDQIIGRIKNEGVSVADAADEHGISTKTIYTWLRAGVEGGQPTVLELNKLKRENKALKELVGEITMQLSRTQKND